MKGPRLTEERVELPAMLTALVPALPGGPSLEDVAAALEREWKRSRKIEALIAWSDAVGEWSARLHDQFGKLSGAWKEEFEKAVSGEERRMG